MIYNLRVVFTLAVKHILAQPGLSIATVLGLSVVTALAMSISVYVDGVYYRSFTEKLSDNAYPPFTLSFSYVGNAESTWEQVQAVDSFMETRLPTELGVPVRLNIQQFKTGAYNLLPIAPADAPSTGRLRFAFLTGIADHITITEGAFPQATTQPDTPVEVLVTAEAAANLDLQVEENFVMRVSSTLQIPVRVSGIWVPNNPDDEFWFADPKTLYDYMIVDEQDFAQRVAAVAQGSYAGDWYVVLNGDIVDYSVASALTDRINRVQNILASQFPTTRLMVSPREALQEYISNAQVLTIQLYTIGTPVMGLLLLFLSLAATLSIESRRNEIALLRSRGAGTLQVVGIASVETLVLGLAALLTALPLSQLFAWLMGKARGFLDFGLEQQLRLQLNTPALLFGVLVLLIAALAQLFPLLLAARHTTISYKQRRSRQRRSTWWQRSGLDMLLLIPAAYGAYVMVQQRTLNTANINANPLENPLLLLVPALGVLALTLLILRLLPLLLSVLTWIIAQTRSVALLMTTRRFARVPASYTMPMILLVLTLSLSAFTAALADSLNDYLHDSAYYALGADAVFYDAGIEIAGMPYLSERYSFLPLSSYVQGPNAYGAARVGDYESRTTVAGSTYYGRFMAVDRYEFPQVAFWRSDFAAEDLGFLMNQMAVDQQSILVPRNFLDENSLTIGDQIVVTIESAPAGVRLDVPARIAGAFDLFPTWYPEEGPLFVGNLDYVFQLAGGDFPYQVWMDVAPEFRRNQMAVSDAQPIALNTPRYQIDLQETLPERQGVFGLLSVGFLSAGMLTVIGFLLHVLFSFRQRFIEMGMLRAIGLSMRQLVALLTTELTFIIALGAGVGTLLGIGASLLFIPYLQVGSAVPSFTVEIAWTAMVRVYLLFSWLFTGALVVLTLLLRQMKIAQAVKLGETV